MCSCRASKTFPHSKTPKIKPYSLLMKKSLSFLLRAGLAFFAVSSIGSAAVKLPSILGSQMVLQQGEPVPIWGWADPGEEVTVTFHDAKVSAKAGKDGKWQVKLHPSKANAKAS